MSAFRAIVLYDGQCGLCHRWVQFVLHRDPKGRIGFGAIQSEFGQAAIRDHARDPELLDTVFVLTNPGTDRERLTDRSTAVLAIFDALGGVYKLFTVGRLVPRRVRDWLYRVVAERRHRLFKPLDACPVPEARWRARFVDLEQPLESVEG